MTEGRIIYNPSKLVLNMFYRKMNVDARKEVEGKDFEAIGLFQTTVAGVLYYGDRVFKTSNVYPVEIVGNCPQNITTLAFFGDTSAVETAMKMIISEEQTKRNRLI